VVTKTMINDDYSDSSGMATTIENNDNSNIREKEEVNYNLN